MELAENKREVGIKRRRVSQRQKELRQLVAAIVEPLRLRCEFVLQNGERSGKMCNKRAKEIRVNGIAEFRSKLCWRHRKYIAKHRNVGIVEIES